MVTVVWCITHIDICVKLAISLEISLTAKLFCNLLAHPSRQALAIKDVQRDVDGVKKNKWKFHPV